MLMYIVIINLIIFFFDEKASTFGFFECLIIYINELIINFIYLVFKVVII